MPAFAIIIASEPISASIFCAVFDMPSRSVTSHAIAVMLLWSSAILSSLSRLRAEIATCQPLLAISRATAAPIPELAPVIQTMPSEGFMADSFRLLKRVILQQNI